MQTILQASRKKQKAIAASKAQQMKQDLLQNLIKHTAVKGVLASKSGEKSAGSSQDSSAAGKNVNSANDMFKLPSLPSGSQPEETFDDYEDYDSDSSIELSPRKQGKWIGNIHTVDVTSADFKALPADVRYDVLTDLKETRKQNSWGRLHEMPDKSHEFSDYQMKRLLKRRQVQESLETAEKEMGGRTLTLEELEKLLTEQGINTGGRDTAYRIASDSTTRLIFINDPKGLKRNSTDEAASSQSSSQHSRSTDEAQLSRDSGNEDSSFARNPTESVIENINEYDIGDSDWESEDDVIMTAKTVEPSPLIRKKYFGKQRINPALAYMLEHAGIPEDEILALMEGSKQKSTKSEKSAPSLTPDDVSIEDNESKKKSCSSKLFSDSEELIDLTQVTDTEKVEKSSSDVGVIKETSFELNSTDKSISTVMTMSSDSDTDSDLVEIQDVPIPETNFGLEITVKSDEPRKDDEEDMFADVFATESAETSDVSTQRKENHLSHQNLRLRVAK